MYFHRIATRLAQSLGGLIVLFMVLPVAILVWFGARGAITHFRSDSALRDSILLTAVTATAATVIGVLAGSPLAYLLARRSFWGRAVLAAVIDMPLLIPHPVAGIALLLFLSRDTMLGGALLAAGIRVVGTPIGIVAAMLFVSVPLYISAAREAFVKVDESYEVVARTLGATPWRAFRRVTLPLAARGMLSGAVVMWSRAVSEFGAVVVLTYNPQVVSVLSYDRLTVRGLHEVVPIAAAIVLLSLIPLTLLRALRYERDTETVL